MNKNEEKITAALFGIYCAGLIIQNILATKSIDVFAFTVTTGILVSPLLFIAQDISSEVFGYNQTKRMVLLSFAMNLIGVVLFQIAIILPASKVYGNQRAFQVILGTTARISAASFIAYIAGSLVNSKIMVTMKRRYNKSLFARAIISTIFGQFLDNAIFAFIAFLFVMPLSALISMVIGGTLFEVLYEVLFYPITKSAIKHIKQSMIRL